MQTEQQRKNEAILMLYSAVNKALMTMGREGANADLAHPLREAWEACRDAEAKTRDSGLLRVLLLPDPTWLNGWPRRGYFVLMGTALHCVGCGADKGVASVAIPDDWKPPERAPDWPFPQDDCPICSLLRRKS